MGVPEIQAFLTHLAVEIDILPVVNERGFLTTPPFYGWSLNGVDVSSGAAILTIVFCLPPGPF
jgi:hypothetical protein